MRIQRLLSLALAVAALAVGSTTPLAAQGTTTGAITGTVTDEKNAPVPNVSVEVVNRANGAKASQITRDNGRFFIPNLEVGTYSVTARRIGFTPQTRTDIVVSLTQATRLDFQLKEQATQLAAVRTEAVTTTSDFSATRQGVQTVLTDTLVRRLPTLNRDITDLIRNSPQVAVSQDGRISAAGQNNRFNNIQIDGVSLANRFGLGASPTVGAQVGGRALPLDAIKEFQILVSPYDVRQGNFTGALVNAVTQSGTNEFKGSAFIYYRDQQMGRDTAFLRTSPFVRRQLGFSLGGPIIKNKLRFFATVETSQNVAPSAGPFYDPTSPTGLVNSPVAAARITTAQVDSFVNYLSSKGIAAGSGGITSNENPLLNTFVRLDYQLSGNTRLVLRNIYNDQEAFDFSRSLGTFNFTSNGFRRTEKSNQIVGQAFTNFANGFSNEFTVGLTTTRFKRVPDVLAPQVLVQNIGGTGSGIGFRAGTENSSQGNELREDLYEIQNNFTMPLGNHIVSIGTRNEIYKAYNAFLQNSYGNYTFNTLADFVANRTPASFSGSGGLGGDVVANFSAAQLAGYIQDQWTVTPRFTTTLGLRIDVPLFFDKPSFAAAVQRDFGRSTADLPSGNLQFSPRVGFNWDATGDQKNQVRGGVGLFQGIPAYVWMSNQFQNTGAGLAQFTCGGGVTATNGAAPLFNATPVSPRGCGLKTNNTPGRSLDDGTFLGTVNLADPDLKFPQLLRATLGYDRKLPGDVIATFDGLYSRSINNFFYNNINIPQTGRIDAQGRTVFANFAATGIPTVAPLFPVYGSNVIELSNQSKDYAYSGTGQLRKRFNGAFEGSVAYTYGRSYSVTDLTSSVALSNWQFGRVYSGLQTDAPVNASLFDQPHRVLVNGTYTAPWKSNQTNITFYYSKASGTPYSFVYSGNGGRGDMNGDGSNANDPIYIPTGPTDPKLGFVATTVGTTTFTPAQQAALLDQFIKDNSCLETQRGTIMKPTSCRNPMFDRFDLTIEQQLPTIRGERATLRLDIFNAANLLNSKWGRIKSATANGNASLLQVQSFSSADPSTQVPNVTFTNNFNTQFTPLNFSQFYQLQASLRLSF
ncbi:carboxypeptidase regulatory-like domain-containing protein [Gemmatimonas sp.]|uniref:TonB-dependent receptor n=1 Tax=Gemmatimonas sp. TaxID=1962908 RepID=UPI00286D6E86|nr:carboxypeptidase regulatory-like domain-containing protein [Gemmatimonas sp.]